MSWSVTGRGGLLYISTSVWVLRTPNPGWNDQFQRFYTTVAEWFMLSLKFKLSSCWTPRFESCSGQIYKLMRSDKKVINALWKTRVCSRLQYWSLRVSNNLSLFRAPGDLISHLRYWTELDGAVAVVLEFICETPYIKAFYIEGSVYIHTLSIKGKIQNSDHFKGNI